MTEYDMDRRGREKSLWEEALEVIKTTTMAELTLRYITLNKPETDETAAPEAMIPTDAILRNISLPEIAARTSLKQQLFEPSRAPPQLSGRIFLVDKKRPLARPFSLIILCLLLPCLRCYSVCLFWRPGKCNDILLICV
uniref:Uncharacterized protein n=1 Tax=Leclercia adecarboxylata TaxID=83655 RepID=A0A7G5F659_9ENTR|nr:hypothetical protein [Leclercia adecarboxylata]